MVPAISSFLWHVHQPCCSGVCSGVCCWWRCQMRNHFPWESLSPTKCGHICRWHCSFCSGLSALSVPHCCASGAPHLVLCRDGASFMLGPTSSVCLSRRSSALSLLSDRPTSSRSMTQALWKQSLLFHSPKLLRQFLLSTSLQIVTSSIISFDWECFI